MIYDTIIVGGGPAGISAAIHLKRLGLKILLLEKHKIGGLLHNANFVQNYLGFPHGIRGEELAALFQNQLEKHKIKVKFYDAREIQRKEKLFVVKTNHKCFFSNTVLIAAGTNPKKLGIEGEAELEDRKVFYEIKNVFMPNNRKIIAVIGSGDIAFDYAINLAKSKCKVNVIMRNRKHKCIPILWQQAKENSRINIHKNVVLERFIEEDNKVKIILKKNGIKNMLLVNYLLIAIGRKPCLTFLPLKWQGQLRKNSNVIEKEGIFLAGDVKLQNFRHASIAIGDGIIAAMKIERFLSCH